MVELTSERLLASYLKYIALKNSIIYIQKQTFSRTNDEFLIAIGFPYLGEIAKDRKEFIGLKIDAMVSAIEEVIILGLVADFESIVFDRVENASGVISKIVKNKYKEKPFKDFSTDFVKTVKDIDKLSVIKAIVSTSLPVELSKEFSEVIDFRNRLAHGKRFGEHSLMSFDEIAKTLDKVLEFI